MERRDVLKLGVVAAGAGGSGCASMLANPGSVSSGDMGGFLSSLDSAMDRIGKGSFFDDLIAGNKDPAHVARIREGEELTKKTLRSLLLVGTLRELPPEQLAHEGVQERLRNSMGEFDDAMFGMTSVIEGLSPAERAKVSKALTDDPNLGMRVMGMVDEEAAAFGISTQQRAKLRAVSSHTCSRLRVAPELTLSEYAGKMRKIEARHGARAQQERALAASLGTAMLFEQAEGSSMGGTVGPAPTDPQVSPPPPPPAFDGTGAPPGQQQYPAPQPLPEKPRSRARPSIGLLTAGGIALGLGATVVGVGFAVGGGFQLFGITIGALLGITGLILLIIGFAFLGAGK